MKAFVRNIFAALSAAVLSLSVQAQVRTDGKTTEIDGVVRLDRTIFDFGEVTLAQGALSCTFSVTNISKKPIVIYNVVSSCGCTAVKWTREPLMPGKTGHISATYSNDEGPYPFDKTLTAYIADVKKPVILRLRGVVRAKNAALTEIYTQRRGALAFKHTDMKLGNLYQGGQRGDAATVANVGTSPLRVTFADITPGLSISVAPNPVPAGGTARMTYIVTSDGNTWGKKYYHATPVVNGVKTKPVSIWTFTVEDFSSWSAERQNDASQPVFDSITSDFGKVRRGAAVSAGFRLKNLGGSPFHVYKADPDVSAVSPSSGFRDVASGAAGEIVFHVDTSRLPSGENDILVILTTNCPLRPTVNLHITGVVE